MLQYLPELDLRHLARPYKPDRRRTRSTGYLNDVTASSQATATSTARFATVAAPSAPANLTAATLCVAVNSFISGLFSGIPVEVRAVPVGRSQPGDHRFASTEPGQSPIPASLAHLAGQQTEVSPVVAYSSSTSRRWSRRHLVREGNHLSRRERVGSTRKLDGVMSGDVDRSVHHA